MDVHQDLADYKSELVDSDGTKVDARANSRYRVLDSTSDYHNTFNEDSPLDWNVSGDKLDDIADDRDE